MKELIQDYFDRLKSTIDKIEIDKIEQFIKVLIDARANNKTIFIMGNGGSATTASHFVCDIAKGASYGNDKRFKVVSLNDNLPMIMAYANDISYDDIFVEQLKNQLQKGDIVIGISGSGNSANVLKAIGYANNKEAFTIGFTGYDGGKLKEIVSLSIDANIDDMQISEDIHLILTHLTMQILNKAGV